jgi:hypothetical protein
VCVGVRVTGAVLVDVGVNGTAAVSVRESERLDLVVCRDSDVPLRVAVARCVRVLPEPRNDAVVFVSESERVVRLGDGEAKLRVRVTVTLSFRAVASWSKVSTRTTTVGVVCNHSHIVPAYRREARTHRSTSHRSIAASNGVLPSISLTVVTPHSGNALLRADLRRIYLHRGMVDSVPCADALGCEQHFLLARRDEVDGQRGLVGR